MQAGDERREAITTRPRQAPADAITKGPVPVREEGDEAVRGRGDDAPGRPPSLRALLWSGAATCAAAVAGYFSGRSLGWPGAWGPPDSVLPLSAILAFVLAVSALGYGLLDEKVGHYPGMALVAYVVSTSIGDPFFRAHDPASGVVAFIWLALPVAGGVLLPPRGHWCAGVGCWVILFAGVAATAYNVIHGISQFGLFSTRYY